MSYLGEKYQKLPRRRTLYVAYSATEDLVKVGVSVNVERRLKSFKPIYPDICVLYEREFEEAYFVETKVLHHFSGPRTEGREWFQEEPSKVITYIERFI